MSLFAQALGTAVPVSDKRLDAAWRAIAAHALGPCPQPRHGWLLVLLIFRGPCPDSVVVGFHGSRRIASVRPAFGAIQRGSEAESAAPGRCCGDQPQCQAKRYFTGREVHGTIPPMRRHRFQFRLSTLLWITLAVACWFGGMRFERWMAARNAPEPFYPHAQPPADMFDDPTP